MDAWEDGHSPYDGTIQEKKQVQVTGLVWCVLRQRYPQHTYLEFIRLVNLDQEFRGEMWVVSRMKLFCGSQGNELSFLASQVIQKLCSILFPDS